MRRFSLPLFIIALGLFSLAPPLGEASGSLPPLSEQGSQAAWLKPAERAQEFTHFLQESFRRGTQVLSQNLGTYSGVTVSGNYRLKEGEIWKTSELSFNRNGLKNSPSEIKSMLEMHPWIERAEVEIKYLPLRVSIEVREIEPWLIAEYEGHSWLVSSSGELIQPLNQIQAPALVMELSELPRLAGLEQVPSGAPDYLASPNARFLYAVKTLRFFEMAGGFPVRADRIQLEQDGVLRIHSAGEQLPEILLRAHCLDDAERLRANLILVLNDLKSRIEVPQLIDLRFENQAIVR